jgi:hypothetical protein
MIDQSKRQFFKRALIHQVAGIMAGFREGVAEVERFFASYESCYALVLAYPDDILLETARKEGVAVEGREKIDIVRELFIKKGGLWVLIGRLFSGTGSTPFSSKHRGWRP